MTSVSVTQIVTVTFGSANDEVINIDIGWGEVKGMPISAGDLAEGVRPGIYRTYAQVLSGLDADASHSSVQAQADASLPATDPLHANFYYVPYAEAKTLGQISPTGTEIDGYIGMSKTASLDFAQPTAAGYFDAIGALEHEISAVMGRVRSLDVIARVVPEDAPPNAAATESGRITEPIFGNYHSLYWIFVESARRIACIDRITLESNPTKLIQHKHCWIKHVF